MSELTDYAEKKMLGVLLGTTWSPSLTVRLGTNVGSDEVPSITEVSGGGYVAQSLPAASWGAASSTTYTFAPCGGGGFTYYRSTATYNAAVTFPVATATWNYDCVFLHDGTDVVHTRGTSGPLNAGYQASFPSGSIQVALDFVSSVACPAFLNRGTVTQLGQRKLIDNFTQKTPWTPTPHLAIRNHLTVPTETKFVDVSGFWDAPSIDGSSRATSFLNTDVDFATVASTFSLGSLGVQLTDGAAYTTEIGGFGFTTGTAPPTLNSGDFLHIESGYLVMRITD